ncbi:hypothetical protein [Arthrobacter sp. FW306-2-2C-D06B]|jgi:hypothetical protein|uniref:hypothetical protein n=1 Tax=Arthrobacter sp. FW306-2-2C-D06B TaxID=2879618 RepID=UPI001F285F50|nr:hypothetical protein [Arthrobacter sp. FW306-2-2C-D06B]UKA58663.1 hypothetical protein LFT47_20750 [Arthrobacter sp. FW306-2-2C-D06B]
MDRRLHAVVKFDVSTDAVEIDVRGSLNQDSRPALVHIVRRIRRMGVTSHIRVGFSRASLVESQALAGLRNDLNAIDGGTTEVGLVSGSGVSLEFTDKRASFPLGAATGSKSIEITGEFGASIDAAGFQPLDKCSDEELLAASDFAFGLLDQPGTSASPVVLAHYDAIGLEISRRELKDATADPAEPQ